MKPNEHRIAVALEYDGENAPVVSASGVADIAEKIIAIAEANGIPLHNDKALVEVLSQINPGEEIPEKLYRAVAEVIAFAYILTGKFPKNWPSQ
ncbi:MAG: flagellar protein FhlB [Gammaproteobacteria bacterium]|nr:MAG: flagellar protein FhlB [Gammaproteobacteria bacterium]